MRRPVLAILLMIALTTDVLAIGASATDRPPPYYVSVTGTAVVEPALHLPPGSDPTATFEFHTLSCTFHSATVPATSCELLLTGNLAGLPCASGPGCKAWVGALSGQMIAGDVAYTLDNIVWAHPAITGSWATDHQNGAFSGALHAEGGVPCILPSGATDFAMVGSFAFV